MRSKAHFQQCSGCSSGARLPLCPDRRQEKFLSVKDTVLASNVEQEADPHHGIPTQQTISSTLLGESMHNDSNPHVQRDNPQRIQNATQKSNSCDRKLRIDTKCKIKWWYAMGLLIVALRNLLPLWIVIPSWWQILPWDTSSHDPNHVQRIATAFGNHCSMWCS